MKTSKGRLLELAMVIAVPLFMGAGSKDGTDGAVMILTASNKLRWTWASSLKVL